MQHPFGIKTHRKGLWSYQIVMKKRKIVFRIKETIPLKCAFFLEIGFFLCDSICYIVRLLFGDFTMHLTILFYWCHFGHLFGMTMNMMQLYNWFFSYFPCNVDNSHTENLLLTYCSVVCKFNVDTSHSRHNVCCSCFYLSLFHPM